MKNFRFINLRFLLALIALMVVPQNLPAQLNSELKQLFLEIKGEFEPDIQKKIDEALIKKTDRIKFTAEEFDRFRKNPVNPFEGLEEIDLKTLPDGIELKFEIPTVRNRPVGEFERQNRGMLNDLSPITLKNAPSIVDVLVDGEVAGLGTIIDSNGTVATKFSEVKDAKTIQIRDYQRVIYPATLLRGDSENDIVLLETAATALPVVVFSDQQPSMGDFLVTGNPSGRALAFGTFSHPPRTLKESEKGFLGVTPRSVGQGVELSEVTSESSAEKAGLKVGDVITKINGKPVQDVTNLVSEVQRSNAGDRLAIEFKRSGQIQVTEVILAGRNLSPDRAARFKMMNRLGAIPSERANDLPWVFQHDTPLFPEQCGGPIVDLNGNVVGINIARQGRVSSLAIPAEHMKAIIDKLKCEIVASTKKPNP